MDPPDQTPGAQNPPSGGAPGSNKKAPDESGAKIIKQNLVGLLLADHHGGSRLTFDHGITSFLREFIIAPWTSLVKSPAQQCCIKKINVRKEIVNVFPGGKCFFLPPPTASCRQGWVPRSHSYFAVSPTQPDKASIIFCAWATLEMLNFDCCRYSPFILR